MSEVNQALLLAFFAGQYKVCVNHAINDKWYICSREPYVGDSAYYLRKNGNLYINTYYRKPSEGYWDTQQEADDFLASWLKGAVSDG